MAAKDAWEGEQRRPSARESSWTWDLGIRFVAALNQADAIRRSDLR